jgi:hypothetical protein
VGSRRGLLTGLGQYPGEVIEILSSHEWEALQSDVLSQNTESGVSFTIDSRGDVHWNYTVCQACDPFNHQTSSPHRRKDGHGAGYNTQVNYNGHNGTLTGTYHPSHHGNVPRGAGEAYLSEYVGGGGSRSASKDRRRGSGGGGTSGGGLSLLPPRQRRPSSDSTTQQSDSAAAACSDATESFSLSDLLLSASSSSSSDQPREKESTGLGSTSGSSSRRGSGTAPVLSGTPPSLLEWSMNSSLDTSSSTSSSGGGGRGSKGQRQRRSWRRSGSAGSSGSNSDSQGDREVIHIAKGVAILEPKP